uniref:Saposin B-type domain-containing protein n=1 Tax=Parastrongyloides trichosuri TaxID=131310 RepID=A0A0N5A424_PARTI
MKFIIITILLGILFTVITGFNPIDDRYLSGVLCSPCKFLFNELRKYIPDVSEASEEVLKENVKEACRDLVGSYPSIDRVCNGIVDDALTRVYNDIISIDKEIDPDKICKEIKMC